MSLLIALSLFTASPAQASFGRTGRCGRWLTSLHGRFKGSIPARPISQPIRTVSLPSYLLGLEGRSYLRALYRQVTRGEVDRIEVGAVIGIKALNLLTHVPLRAPVGRTVMVFGHTTVALMMMKRAQGEKYSGEWRLTDEDLLEFDRALRILRIEQACRALHGTVDLARCGHMYFSYPVGRIDEIRWSRLRRL